MYCVYFRKVNLCPDEERHLPTGFVTSEEDYAFLIGDFETIEDARNYLIGINAVQRWEAQPQKSCIDCLEYIILDDNFESLEEKIVPDYIKCHPQLKE